ncbi:uncharacterized protein [Dasypus novemcinctus]|uniref:uncharacterized protein isoform X2 n=1 Tax=Dasypus novemcinctus TaxID=9361 RepID=UPI0039C90478
MFANFLMRMSWDFPLSPWTLSRSQNPFQGSPDCQQKACLQSQNSLPFTAFRDWPQPLAALPRAPGTLHRWLSHLSAQMREQFALSRYTGTKPGTFHRGGKIDAIEVTTLSMLLCCHLRSPSPERLQLVHHRHIIVPIPRKDRRLESVKLIHLCLTLCPPVAGLELLLLKALVIWGRPWMKTYELWSELFPAARQ